MKERLNVTKSVDGDVSVPMATTRKSADDYDKESVDDTEGESGSCRSVCGDVPVCHGGITLCFP